MKKTKHCKYCGVKTSNSSCICNTCTEKLILIRKIRALLFAIKRDAEGRLHHGPQGID